MPARIAAAHDDQDIIRAQPPVHHTGRDQGAGIRLGVLSVVFALAVLTHRLHALHRADRVAEQKFPHL